jgi:integrase/recombinase XerD
LRVGEVIRARIKELFVAGGSLDVPPFKRGRGRGIRLHASLVGALQQEIAGRKATSDRLLCNCRGGAVNHTQLQAMAEALFGQLLGPGHGLTFHSLRHTFAMRLYAETRDLFLVQSKLGHRSVKSTEVYARSLADVPDSCLVNVSAGVIQPGQQLRLFG